MHVRQTISQPQRLSVLSCSGEHHIVKMNHSYYPFHLYNFGLNPMYMLPFAGHAMLHSVQLCRGSFRSEARYIVSEDADLTQGVGWVTSMAGVMKFSKLRHAQRNSTTASLGFCLLTPNSTTSQNLLFCMTILGADYLTHPLSLWAQH